MYVGEEDGKLHFVDKDGADTVLNFNSTKSEIIISDIFLPPHRDNPGHIIINVEGYSNLFVESIVTSRNDSAKISSDIKVLGTYKNGDSNINLNISEATSISFINGLQTTDWGRYVQFKNVIIS